MLNVKCKSQSFEYWVCSGAGEWKISQRLSKPLLLYTLTKVAVAHSPSLSHFEIRFTRTDSHNTQFQFPKVKKPRKKKVRGTKRNKNHKKRRSKKTRKGSLFRPLFPQILRSSAFPLRRPTSICSHLSFPESFWFSFFNTDLFLCDFVEHVCFAL